jgi:DNA-binding response OmpR family regulator
MDADPGIDREHFSLVLHDGRRHQLSPAEWRLFTALYQRHGRIVPLAELATATRNAESKLNGIIHRLRRSLVRSRFMVLMHRARGYELIVRAEERRQSGNSWPNEEARPVFRPLGDMR